MSKPTRLQRKLLAQQPEDTFQRFITILPSRHIERLKQLSHETSLPAQDIVFLLISALLESGTDTQLEITTPAFPYRRRFQNFLLNMSSSQNCASYYREKKLQREREHFAQLLRKESFFDE